MSTLEEHVRQFWTFMQKWKHHPLPLSSAFAKDNELPTLAARTPHQKLSNRIYKELNNDNEREIS